MSVLKSWLEGARRFLASPIRRGEWGKLVEKAITCKANRPGEVERTGQEINLCNRHPLVSDSDYKIKNTNLSTKINI